MKCETIVTGGTMDEKEINAYIEHGREKYGRTPTRLSIHIDGEYVDLDYDFGSIPFERIRRITGYLVGTLDRFNNGKRAEESERVKHSIA